MTSLAKIPVGVTHFCMGVATTLLLVVALGAANNPAPTSPRYTVNYAGGGTFITDNQTNLLHVYIHTAKGMEWQNSLDLNKTGSKVIPGIQEQQAAAKNAIRK